MAYLQCVREFAHIATPAFCAQAATVLRSGYGMAMARLPTDCLLCQGRAHAGGLCALCLADLVCSMRNKTPRCPVCALALNGLGRCPDCTMHRPAFDRVIAAFDYTSPGDLLVHRLKAGGRFDCAPMLADVLARQIEHCQVQTRWAKPGSVQRTIVVPVPSGKSSMRWRGFNPAAEVARFLARRLRLAYCPGAVRKVRQGSSQKYLSRTARLLNTQNMYRCCGNVAQAHVAVVDDVLTTGSTAHSIALQLKAAGAASVSVWVLARTPHYSIDGGAGDSVFRA